VGPQIAARLVHCSSSRGSAEGAKIARHDAPSTRDISAGDSWSHPRPRLPQPSRLLSVRMVPPQRGHECRRAAGRNAGAVFMSEDGMHGVRPGRRRRAAGLVAGYEQAAVLIRSLRRTSPLRLRVRTGRHLLVPTLPLLTHTDQKPDRNLAVRQSPGAPSCAIVGVAA